MAMLAETCSVEQRQLITVLLKAVVLFDSYQLSKRTTALRSTVISGAQTRGAYELVNWGILN
jgi:hypothetical protein